MLKILERLDTEKLSNLDDIIDEVLLPCMDWQKEMSIKNRLLYSAVEEQSDLLAKYEKARLQIKTLLDYVSFVLKKERSKSFRVITNTSKIAHSDRAKEKLVDSDDKIIALEEKQILCQQAYDALDSVAYQLKNRGYNLNNLVKLSLELYPSE